MVLVVRFSDQTNKSLHVIQGFGIVGMFVPGKGFVVWVRVFVCVAAQCLLFRQEL